MRKTQAAQQTAARPAPRGLSPAREGFARATSSPALPAGGVDLGSAAAELSDSRLLAAFVPNSGAPGTASQTRLLSSSRLESISDSFLFQGRPGSSDIPVGLSLSFD